MPIKSENRDRYPGNWKTIAERVRERSGDRCEWTDELGIRCPARNSELSPITGSRVVLTVMHLDHNPENCAMENPLHACQLHHNRYDVHHRIGTRRGDRERRDRQLELL